MLYKFKSSATGDLIMLGPQGDQLMTLLGRAPAAQGIIEPAAMPAAIAALEAAIAADGGADADAAEAAGEAGDDAAAARNVGLKARLWPMIEMLRRAHAADAAVVWGV